MKKGPYSRTGTSRKTMKKNTTRRFVAIPKDGIILNNVPATWYPMTSDLGRRTWSPGDI
jgi:hypothetical protein